MTNMDSSRELVEILTKRYLDSKGSIEMVFNWNHQFTPGKQRPDITLFRGMYRLKFAVEEESIYFSYYEVGTWIICSKPIDLNKVNTICDLYDF